MLHRGVGGCPRQISWRSRFESYNLSNCQIQAYTYRFPDAEDLLLKGCRVLEADEVRALLVALSLRDRLVVLTGLHFGARISETLALTFGDVAGRFLSIKSAKGSDNVTFEIPANYRSEVAALQASYEQAGKSITAATPLFLSRKGINRAITRQQASAVITAACARLGIDGKVNSHSARKTFVTRIYHLTGKDIAETKKYSRHKSLANLDYYISTTQDLSLVAQLDWSGVADPHDHTV